ncbi:MAG: ribonuclease III [Candidatus Dojkabacteria bacterium]|nr:ribonuclease III [Candidatus Dojkabacteria bacterium]
MRTIRRITMIEELTKELKIKFNDISLLERALTHRSYLNENRDIDRNNERLEFLGDAVLELIISKHLYENYPDNPEGDLTSFRSAIVRTESLAEASRELGYGKYLRLAKGEEETGGRDKDYILANTFEAVLGAIYVDQGLEECKDLVYRVLVPKIDNIVKNRLDIDCKTKIQEVAQAKYKLTPVYEVVEENGPDHDKEFVVVVKIGDKVIGQGKGGSKQKAEEAAANEGLKYIEKA